eukprot:9014110-Pyramimonas_sp.AAC.1
MLPQGSGCVSSRRSVTAASGYGSCILPCAGANCKSLGGRTLGWKSSPLRSRDLSLKVCRGADSRAGLDLPMETDSSAVSDVVYNNASTRASGDPVN